MVRSLIQCWVSVHMLFADHASAVHHGGRMASRTALRGKHASRTIVSNTTDGKVYWRSTVCVNGQCNTTESTMAPEQLRETPSLDGNLGRFDHVFDRDRDFTRMGDIFDKPFVAVDDFFGTPFNSFFGSSSSRLDDIVGHDSSTMFDGVAIPLLTGNLSKDGTGAGMTNSTSTSSSFEQTLGEDGQVHYTMTTCRNGECKTVRGEGQPDEQAVKKLWEKS
ncbi:unnamed protein product [Prorocentrum cordatum]|uniref:Uncharacterized protein n=1 Tax=Prorocentrum cordatum TaxID=2364126 RepID=A0ABN9RNT2_9DINO|nr:unnamed protein product [Polarella glacialis]